MAARSLSHALALRSCVLLLSCVIFGANKIVNPVATETAKAVVKGMNKMENPVASPAAKAAVKGPGQSLLLQFTAQAVADRAHCFSVHNCASCLLIACTYCIHADARTCINQTATPGFCPAGNLWATRCPATPVVAALSGRAGVASREACKKSKCEYNVVTQDARQMCTLELMPWLRSHQAAQSFFRPRQLADSFFRFDVIFKATLARHWLLNITTGFNWELMYLHFIGARTGRKHARIRLEMFRALVASVQRDGFNWGEHPIEVSTNFRINDGAHRAGLALALNETRISVSRQCNASRETGPNVHTLQYTRSVLGAAPAAALVHEAELMGLWGHSVPSALPATALSREADHARLQHATAARLVVLVWGCARPLWPLIEADVRLHSEVTIARALHVHLLGDFVRQVYEVDDIATDKVEIKVAHLAPCPSEVLALEIRSVNPLYRRKRGSGSLISAQMERLKASVRGKYKDRVPMYIHDIIIHGSDNENVHTRHIERLLGRTHIDGVCGSANLLACVESAMRQRNISVDDFVVVGSSVLAGWADRPGHDVDVLVRPAFRARATKSSHATIIAPGVQVVASGWLGPHGSDLADEHLMDDDRWRIWTTGKSVMKQVKPELALLKKCSSNRPKDEAHLAQLLRRPFAWDHAVLVVANESMPRRSAKKIRSSVVCGALLAKSSL
mmetsp:Transcript_7272/g.18933  ORF Transcript_7272/g.18933 Transcript_7272/m.18933 type:complete len:679 (-) Transcript_7272:456-2492(-)